MKQLPFATVALMLTVLTACGSDDAAEQPPFAERDPKGYEACSEWAGNDKETDSMIRLNGRIEVGELARKAGTKAIRDSVEPMFDAEAMEGLRGTSSEGQNFYFVDEDKFETACRAEGFEL